MGDRAETVTTASALLKQSKLTPEVRSEALYFRAKALLAEGQKKAALADLTELAKDTRNVYGAEAKYLVAQTYFDEGETAKAEKEVLWTARWRLSSICCLCSRIIRPMMTSPE